MAHVERVNLRRAALEQAVGEPARRGPDIETGPTCWIDGKGVQRRLEL